jgi:hypothetical protein
VHLSTSGGEFNPATVRAPPAAIQHDVYRRPELVA